MKMVLVYDTENVEDLQNSIAIMRKLVNDFDRKYGTMRGLDRRQFDKIQLIKILREWERVAKTKPRSAGTHKDVASLKSVKDHVDEIWENHVER
jgi:hypothetical protein